jgi:hypothetical protein
MAKFEYLRMKVTNGNHRLFMIKLGGERIPEMLLIILFRILLIPDVKQ